MNPFTKLVLAGSALTLSVGCQDLALEAVTAPPATGVAELNATDLDIRISDGVALGIACTSTTCNDAVAETDDASIAMVRSASTDYLRDEWRDQNQPASIFVLVGAEEGKTQLHVTSPEGDVTYQVEVLPR